MAPLVRPMKLHQPRFSSGMQNIHESALDTASYLNGPTSPYMVTGKSKRFETKIEGPIMEGSERHTISLVMESPVENETKQYKKMETLLTIEKQLDNEEDEEVLSQS
jgi:hypothetical protein